MDLPILPTADAMQWGLAAGWAVLLAWLLVALLQLVSAAPMPRVRRVWAAWLALAAILVCWLPGAWSPAYHLGLAFQTPSVMSVVLCAMALWRWLVAQPAVPHCASSAVQTTGQRTAITCAALAGVALGWYLLLDTLALVRGSVYAWGYGRYALWSLLALALGWTLVLHWVLQASTLRCTLPLWIVLLVFASTRLTTGNVWDALLDPWLWLALHVVVWQQVKPMLRSRRAVALQ